MKAWWFPCLLALTGTLAAPLATSRVARAQAGSSTPEMVEPQAYRVYQRDRKGEATIPILLKPGSEAKITDVDLVRSGEQTGEVEDAEFSDDDNMLLHVPTGGPYFARITLKIGSEVRVYAIGPLFVGDVWVLAGQSNMQGLGELVDVTPPDDRVMLLGMEGQWQRAEEPLHWLVDSPDPVHSGDAATRQARSKREHKTRTKGAGLGLPFGVAMADALDVPIGLVACAHGGTSMAEWSPDKKDQGGGSLYGSMMRQFKLTGGKVKGVLWYQGEAEASEKASAVYPKVFADFIAAVRSDFGQPDLPFYLVQIGRFVQVENPRYWNAVQDIQRRLVRRVPHTAVVSVVDLELDDIIHVGTPGLKRAGKRLARVALHELFGRPGGTTPTLDRVFRGPKNTLLIKFRNVNLNDPFDPDETPDAPGLLPARHIAGFSIRKDDGSEIPLIFDAAVATACDTVVLKLTGKIPPGARLWYGWGYNPYCNLVDSADMAVPVFGPVKLDDVP